MRKKSGKSNRVALIVGPLVALLVVLMALWYYGAKIMKRRKPHPEAKSDLADPSNPLSLNNLIERMEALEAQPESSSSSSSSTATAAIDQPPPDGGL